MPFLHPFIFTCQLFFVLSTAKGCDKQSDGRGVQGLTRFLNKNLVEREGGGGGGGGREKPCRWGVRALK